MKVKDRAVAQVDRTITFEQVSISSLNGSHATKELSACPVMLDKKYVYLGPNTNYKVSWKDIEDIQCQDDSFQLTDAKHQRVFDCRYIAAPCLRHWEHFRSMVEKKQQKRDSKMVDSSNRATTVGALRKTTTGRKKPQNRYGKSRAHQQLPSSSLQYDNAFFRDDDDQDDCIMNDVKTRVEEDVRQEQEPEHLVVSLPHDETNDDEPMLEQEEDLQDPFDFVDQQKQQQCVTKTPATRRVQGRKRLRKKIRSIEDEDSDDDDAFDAKPTTRALDQRVVTPHDNNTNNNNNNNKHRKDSAISEEEEEEEEYAERQDADKPEKGQKSISTFFAPKSTKSKSTATKGDANMETEPKKNKTNQNHSSLSLGTKRAYSATKKAMKSPIRTQQTALTPRKPARHSMDLDQPIPSSPEDNQQLQDSPVPTISRKKMRKPFVWSSGLDGSDAEEEETTTAVKKQKHNSPLTTSNSSSPKRPQLQKQNLFKKYGSIARRQSNSPPKHNTISNALLPLPEVVEASPYKGFRNMGNTCYLNSSLQMLYTIHGLIPAIEGKGGILVRSIAATAKALFQNPYRPGPASAKAVKAAMDTKSDKFLGFEQRDAHEFLGDLIDVIHEELIEKPADNETAAKSDSEQPKEDSRVAVEEADPTMSPPALITDPSEGATEKPPTDDYFRCDIEVCLTCNSCGYSRTKQEIYRHLSLDIEHHQDDNKENIEQSVQKSLELFFKAEEREIKCEKCEEGKTASQTLRLLNRPKALLLHLKRFIFEEKVVAPTSPEKDNNKTEDPPRRQVEITFRKNKAPVAITETVTLEKFIADDKSPKASATNNKYSIKSLVYHIGARASSGHYTADAIRTRPRKNGDAGESAAEREWVTFDDSRTDVTTLPQILSSERKQKTAYMMLYTLD